jgi:hypothetical protein
MIGKIKGSRNPNSTWNIKQSVASPVCILNAANYCSKIFGVESFHQKENGVIIVKFGGDDMQCHIHRNRNTSFKEKVARVDYIHFEKNII